MGIACDTLIVPTCPWQQTERLPSTSDHRRTRFMLHWFLMRAPTAPVSRPLGSFRLPPLKIFHNYRKFFRQTMLN